jgi:hypothetical protein
MEVGDYLDTLMRLGLVRTGKLLGPYRAIL